MLEPGDTVMERVSFISGLQIRNVISLNPKLYYAPIPFDLPFRYAGIMVPRKGCSLMTVSCIALTEKDPSPVTRFQGDLTRNGVVGEAIPLFPASYTLLFRFRNVFVLCALQNQVPSGIDHWRPWPLAIYHGHGQELIISLSPSTIRSCSSGDTRANRFPILSTASVRS